ncbi:metabolite traffic protein EboE [Pleurocapsales cyanobacterium LEGE 10410]|nr:metabolite traffic protein EboE [Pleurocapsales cyanobacterium LEGE 10410]
MKLATKTDLHLTYCTNIHPGETWTEVEQNLKQYILPLKTRLSPDRPFGIGLRLANIAAKELLDEDNLARFQTWLQTQDLYVFTLNGFPYGGFHHQIVKDKVYAPDWRSSERLDYTVRLMEILKVLLPDSLDGGISTLPISYKPWQQNHDDIQQTLHQSSLNLAIAIAKMVRIHQNTGKLLHIDLEPEPDGMLENTAEMIDFFQDWLLPIAGKWLQQELSVSQAIAESWITEHIRVCYDTCHFAVEYEEPKEIVQKLACAGIKIGKIQLSSAIKIDIPTKIEQRQLILEKLLPFAESTYLHQVIARHGDKSDLKHLKHYSDLSTALPHFLTTEAKEWRTHFHVPIFIRNYTTGLQRQLFESTQEHIEKLLQLLSDNFVSHHLEIETYTWEVLPPEMKLDILTSIEREYRWVLSAIADY